MSLDVGQSEGIEISTDQLIDQLEHTLSSKERIEVALKWLREAELSTSKIDDDSKPEEMGTISFLDEMQQHSNDILSTYLETEGYSIAEKIIICNILLERYAFPGKIIMSDIPGCMEYWMADEGIGIDFRISSEGYFILPYKVIEESYSIGSRRPYKQKFHILHQIALILGETVGDTAENIDAPFTFEEANMLTFKIRNEITFSGLREKEYTNARIDGFYDKSLTDYLNNQWTYICNRRD